MKLVFVGITLLVIGWFLVCSALYDLMSNVQRQLDVHTATFFELNSVIEHLDKRLDKLEVSK